ncbi:MAG: sigma-54-dependent Fis family transcriptional regulator [Deltaproteobacteria bacterium]|nr:sigma-54-dependent Fis family transcriptional regulator [Deltaproteobacteria bacterium]MCW5807933.1 sigma-54-dependent Fis family transcriptional regulator [Deltaproteobacteria bacterium]
MTTVFVIDDEREMVDLIALGLKKRGFTMGTFGSGAEALAAIPARDVDVIVTDLNMKGMTGLEVCQKVVADRPDIPVIVLTAFGSFETAVGAIRAGAYDFVTKPVEVEALAIAVRRAAEHRSLRGEVRRLREVVANTRGRGDLIGASPAMQQVYELIDQVSATDATVLLTGESGTGKEAVAREIHNRSRRSAGPFVSVNCAAVPEALLEAELFGQAKGAAVAGGANGGAGDGKQGRPGLFQQAAGGTVFLDEIGDMALALQPKLLRALQERKARPVGGDAEVPIDVRLVAATNRDLEEMVEAKLFREDLYYRIHVIHIPLPPVRARGGDVVQLAQHFVKHHAAVFDKKVTGLSAVAAERMMAYDWPGNVRELGNCIERAVALTRFEEIQVDDLPEKIRTSRRPGAMSGPMSGTDITELLTLEEVERRHVVRVLEACDRNRTDAAKMLGLDRKTLYRKLLRWGVTDA